MSNTSKDIKDKLSRYYTKMQNSTPKASDLDYLNVTRNLIKQRPAIFHVTVTKLIFKQ